MYGLTDIRSSGASDWVELPAMASLLDVEYQGIFICLLSHIRLVQKCCENMSRELQRQTTYLDY